MQTSITLYKGNPVWLAHWQGDDAAEIKRLFGTAILPTAYDATTDAETVRAEIAQRNPDRMVCIAS